MPSLPHKWKCLPMYAMISASWSISPGSNMKSLEWRIPRHRVRSLATHSKRSMIRSKSIWNFFQCFGCNWLTPYSPISSGVSLKTLMHSINPSFKSPKSFAKYSRYLRIDSIRVSRIGENPGLSSPAFFDPSGTFDSTRIMNEICFSISSSLELLRSLASTDLHQLLNDCKKLSAKVLV